jgi:hypothetical protein
VIRSSHRFGAAGIAAITLLLAACDPFGGGKSTSSPPPQIYGSDLPATPNVSCTIRPELVPTCGAWWGAAVATAGNSLAEAVSAAQARTGRRLDIVHTYHDWTDKFPTANETALAHSGHILLINWQPTDTKNRPIPWSSIADGHQDDVIRTEASRLAALAVPVMLSFSHEPEADLGKQGSAAQFVAAYRHVHDLVVAAGAHNVVWIWDLEGITSSQWLAKYSELWPGAAYVDWIAWDPYNFASCRSRPWLSFAQLISPFYTWISKQPFGHLPLMIAEYGTIEGAAHNETKQRWYQQAAAAIPTFPAIKAFVYFDYPKPPASCNWLTTTPPSASIGFAQLATSPTFQFTARLNP